jgi:hypothetical protein
MLSYDNLQVQRMASRDKKLSINIRSAITLFLTDSTIIPEEGQRKIDLFNSGNDSVLFSKYHWGLYTAASIRAEYNGKTKTRTFFCGAGLSNTLDGCLFLADHNRPLAIGGDTRLSGKAYLPKSSVMAVYVDQRAYSSSTLVNGSIQNSTALLPEPDNRFIKNLQNLAALCSLDIKKIYNVPYIPDSAEYSFLDSAYIIHEKGPVFLSNKILKGHLMIVSDSLIEVRNSSKLENIVLISPVIRFTKGFIGSVQAIATDSLIVENDCRLLYPSSAVILKNEKSPPQPQLSIGSDCTFAGLIYAFAKTDDLKKTYVHVGMGSSITGLIYANGYLNIQASVSGSVLTDYFIFKTPQSLFENQLIDVTIDRNHLPADFIFPDIYNINNTNRVMQWLN